MAELIEAHESAKKTIVSMLESADFEAVAEHYSAEELQERVHLMLEVVNIVLDGKKVASFSFDDSTDQHWNLDENRIHFGLGKIKRLIENWQQMDPIRILNAAKHLQLDPLLTEFLAHHPPPHSRELLLNWQVPGSKKSLLKVLIDACLQSTGAHEAGHRCIDKHPVKDLGMAEKYNRIGFGALAGSILDCAVDTWVMHHQKSKSPLGSTIGSLRQIHYEYAFGGGQLDWVQGFDEELQKNGYTLLFDQFGLEVLRVWIAQLNGEQISINNLESFADPATDSRVFELLRREITIGQETRTVWQQLERIWDPKGKCLPQKNDPDTLIKIASRNKLMALEPVYELYESELVTRDRENQIIHQAISAFGLQNEGFPLPAAVEEKMNELFLGLEPALQEELHRHLNDQSAEKKTWLLQQADMKHYRAGVRGQLIEQLSDQEILETLAEEPQSLFEALGPAVLVEEKQHNGVLSRALREWLLESFDELRQLALSSGEKLSNPAKEVFGDPDKPIKDRESVIVDLMRPQVLPKTVPAMHDPRPQDLPQISPPPPLHLPDLSNLIEIPKSELDGARAWLEREVEMTQRVKDLRKALQFMEHTGTSHADTGTKLDIERAIRKSIARAVRDPNIDFRIFQEEREPEQRFFRLSIVVRTCHMLSEDLLKLLLYFEAIGSDRTIAHFFDFEILLSQNVPELPRPDEHPGSVVKAFGESFIGDWENIEPRILAIKHAGVLSITDDAGALHLTRTRLSKTIANPGKKKPLGMMIDIWDGLAIGDPLRFHIGQDITAHLDPRKTVEEQLESPITAEWQQSLKDFFKAYQEDLCRLFATNLQDIMNMNLLLFWLRLNAKLSAREDMEIAIRKAREQFQDRVFSIHYRRNHSPTDFNLEKTYGKGHYTIDRDVKNIIHYLDALLHNMVKCPTNPAQDLEKVHAERGLL